MDGILNISKPPGKTSFRVVAMVRRLSGEKRVGHAGTLDPMATGVLPVCLGQGTRVIEYLQKLPKTYKAVIELGVTTDTYDITGKVQRRADITGIDRGRLVSALDSFRGLIAQTPPMYSALKRAGRPLYQLARMGIEVERKSRPARVYRLELSRWQPPLASIEVECGKGTYIRSLAHDLGQLLGCGASLAELTRTAYGPFTIEEAVPCSVLENAFASGHWRRLLYPIDHVLRPLAAVVVGEATEKMIRAGRPVAFTASDGGLTPGHRVCRAYSRGGYLLGLLRYDQETGQWQPEKVFSRRS